jgi:pimeloyl-ACP methyl ester carboxylesterase
MCRLRGGGGSGDDVKAQQHLPPAQLAILPGTTHVTLVDHPDWLLSMITAFIDARTEAR